MNDKEENKISKRTLFKESKHSVVTFIVFSVEIIEEMLFHYCFEKSKHFFSLQMRVEDDFKATK